MYSIVIADDEPRICNMIKTIIQANLPQFHIIKDFTNGTDLYDYVEKNPVDIILTDIEMPGKTGLEIAKFVNNKGYNSYLIILTAYKEFHYAKTALDCKVDAFLTKPFSTEQLLDEIQKGLNILSIRDSHSAQHHTIQRKLLQALCSSYTPSLFTNDLLICKNRLPVSDLKCVEIEIHSESISILNHEQQENLIHRLISSGERDEETYAMFFIGISTACVKFLLFYSEFPSETIFNELVAKITVQVEGSTDCTTRLFNSFDEYRMYLLFMREMDAFYKTLSSGDMYSAERALRGFLENTSQTVRQEFRSFFVQMYNMVPAPISEKTEDLMSAVRQLVDITIGNRSRTSIVVSAREYIDKMYASADLSLESVSRALAVSSGYLGRIFRKHMGLRFSEYLFSVRMNHAQRLLESTSMSIIEISFAVGYSNPAYFRSSFKSHLGITPRQYRQNKIMGVTESDACQTTFQKIPSQDYDFDG